MFSAGVILWYPQSHLKHLSSLAQLCCRDSERTVVLQSCGVALQLEKLFSVSLQSLAIIGNQESIV